MLLPYRGKDDSAVAVDAARWLAHSDDHRQTDGKHDRPADDGKAG
jgi:hypothetical protein